MHVCLVATGGSACPLQALLLSIDVFDQLQQFKQTLRSSHTRPKYDGPGLGQEFFSHNCDFKRFMHSSWAVWFLRAIKSPRRAWHASSSGTPPTGYDSSFSNSLATLSSINCSISFHFASSRSFSCNSQDRRYPSTPMHKFHNITKQPNNIQYLDTNHEKTQDELSTPPHAAEGETNTTSDAGNGHVASKQGCVNLLGRSNLWTKTWEWDEEEQKIERPNKSEIEIDHHRCFLDYYKLAKSMAEWWMSRAGGTYIGLEVLGLRDSEGEEFLGRILSGDQHHLLDSRSGSFWYADSSSGGGNIEILCIFEKSEELFVVVISHHCECRTWFLLEKKTDKNPVCSNTQEENAAIPPPPKKKKKQQQQQQLLQASQYRFPRA